MRREDETRVHKIELIQTKFRPIPSGRYKVRLINIIEGETGLFGQEIFIYVFEVVEGEFEKCFINCPVNVDVKGQYGIGNKMGKITRALKQVSNIGDYLDIYDLIGLECFAEIEMRQGKKMVNRMYRWERIDGQQ